MSFSIGPVMGKRDAVIKAVQAAKTGSDESQLNAAKAFIVAELEHLAAEQIVSVQAYGHHYGGPGITPQRQVVVNVNYGQLLQTAALPQFVE